MTRGHGWSLTITMRGTFTPYSLPAFSGAFDATPLFPPAPGIDRLNEPIQGVILKPTDVILFIGAGYHVAGLIINIASAVACVVIQHVNLAHDPLHFVVIEAAAKSRVVDANGFVRGHSGWGRLVVCVANFIAGPVNGFKDPALVVGFDPGKFAS